MVVGTSSSGQTPVTPIVVYDYPEYGGYTSYITRMQVLLLCYFEIIYIYIV
jgi:hypothetical protein